MKYPVHLVRGACSFRSSFYQAGSKTRELETSNASKQLDVGVMEPTQSTWAGPVLFVSKKNENLMCFIDYGKHIPLSVKDAYHLLCMDQCIDTLGYARIFTTLDAYTG